MSVVEFVLIGIILLFVYLEWDYRSKRDGSKEATRAMLFAASVFAVGMLSEHFFKNSGPLAAVIYLIVVFVIAYLSKNKRP